jgi:hypothetical protein
MTVDIGMAKYGMKLQALAMLPSPSCGSSGSWQASTFDKVAIEWGE